MGQLTGFLGRYFGLRFANQTIIPLIRHVFLLEAVKKFKFCPNLLRTGAGTENGIMASIQCALRENMAAHKYGSSIANQRIENWWSSMRRLPSGESVNLSTFLQNNITEKSVSEKKISYMIRDFNMNCLKYHENAKTK